MAADPKPRGIRYDAAIATGIGLLAVAVSAYTAYLQRQQVRAQVWPVLEFSSGNEPRLHLSLANKGVGPALVKHLVVTVDDKAAADWGEVLTRLLGPGSHGYSYDTVGHAVFSAGEHEDILLPHLEGGAKGPAARFDKERFRIGVELCYCSALGECWMLTAKPAQEATTEATGRCPQPSARTFKQ